MTPTKPKKTSENEYIPDDVNIGLKPETKVNLPHITKKPAPIVETEKLEDSAELILIGGLRLKLSPEDAIHIKNKMGTKGRYNLRSGEILLLDAVIGIVNPANLIKG